MNKYELMINFLIASTFALGFTLLVFYFLGKEKVKDVLANSSKITSGWNDSVLKFLARISLFLTPKRGQIADYYEKLLFHYNISVNNFFKIKNLLLAIVFIFLFSVSLTDKDMAISEIYSKFDYVSNPLVNTSGYSKEEKERILKEKNKIFDALIKRNDIDYIMSFDDSMVEYMLSGIIRNMEENTGIDSEILGNEMRVKLLDYKTAQKINISKPIMFGLIFYFLPEIIMYVLQFLNRANEKAEKRFLKRLIIMNGSIKPTDFMMVLAELIDKSKYFKKILLEIEDSNKKNYEENTKIYQKYIQSSTDLETKLFFEKLDEANNYDFDQAIINIKNEFNLDKRMETRKCKKMVENIHVWGLVGFMLLIVMIIFYLLMPWMTAYDMGAMMG